MLDIAGQTVEESRGLYKALCNIPDKAVATLNGKKVKASEETSTILCDEDSLTFKIAKRSKSAYLVGALLLGLVITGSVFAYGYSTASTTLSVTAAGADYASVTANTSSTPNWFARGLFKGSTGSGTLFDVDTTSSNYTGDMTVTVTIANIDEIVDVYRHLALSIEVRDSGNNLVDINGDGNADSKDYDLLTLGNAAVDLNMTQVTADSYTIKLLNGYYLTNVWGSGWTSGHEIPTLYCEVAQR